MKYLNITGNQNFIEFTDKKTFYVDKTLFIKDYIDNIRRINLITRPRRFGKTLNLDMLDEFLNITKDSKDLFKNTLINNHPDYIEKHINKYPIIRLNFSEISGDNYEKFVSNLVDYLSEILNDFQEKLKSLNISEFDKRKIEKNLDGVASAEEIKKSIKLLSKILYNNYNQKVIILIDEYDYPFEEAYNNNYYEEMKSLFGDVLHYALKNNPYLYGALLVGVKKVAQASLLSKLNNLDAYTIESPMFSTYFGFTEDEVKDSLEKFGLSNEFENVKKWYDGYNIGGNTIYNPWNISCFLEEKRLIPYWVNTGGTNTIINILKNLPNYNELREKIEKDKLISATYKSEITYDHKMNYDEAISLLYDAGYLKRQGKYFRVVNYEVKRAFISIFSTIYKDDPKVPECYKRCLDELGMLKLHKVRDYFQKAIGDIKSKDMESYLYHILDMMKISIQGKFITSREEMSSSGISDFIMRDYDFELAFIIEDKKSESKSVDYMFKEAFTQIEKGNYDSGLKALGYKRIFKVVIVVSNGKVHLKITSDNKDNLVGIDEEFLY